MNTIPKANCGSFALPTAQVSAIDFSDVRTNDFLLIFTRNNFYSFRVTNASEMRGHLVGGAALSDGFEAVLLGALIRHGRREVRAERATLQTNSRALFSVATDGEERKLMTSAITRLVCLRSRDAN